MKAIITDAAGKTRKFSCNDEYNAKHAAMIIALEANMCVNDRALFCITGFDNANDKFYIVEYFMYVDDNGNVFVHNASTHAESMLCGKLK